MKNYNQYTKELFKQALKELLNKKPLEKITVKMLAEKCGTTRQVFYYHFKDLYDLVNSIYSEEIAKAFDGFPGEPYIVRLKRLYSSIYSQRNFYKKVFSINGQNALVEYIVEHNRNLQKKLILENDPSIIIDTQTEFAIDFFSCAAIYMTRYWLNRPNTLSPEEFCDYLYSNVPLALKEKHP
jgi:AcrR family transcriptional regulator